MTAPAAWQKDAAERGGNSARRGSWALAAHVRALWGPWWLLPAIPLIYGLILLAFGEVRSEHLAAGLLCIALGYAAPRTKRFLVDVSPYVLVLMGYDVVRYLRGPFVTANRVLGCELRQLELSLFSVAPGVTLQEWLVAHAGPSLDLVFAAPYAIFAYLAFGYAAFLHFVDRPRMRHYLWSFAVANFVAFACWLALPAAPPWYVHAHGCAIDLGVAPNPAGLLRVDERLGFGYFTAFYGRAASVFGALPSLHCAYPLIGLLTAWRAASATRVLHVGYVLLMFVASMYLDHHWLVDGLAGWLLAVVAVAVAGFMLRRVERATKPGAFPAELSRAHSGVPG